MSVEELIAACRAAIQSRAEWREKCPGLFTAPAKITLVLPRKAPKGDRCRLFGRKGGPMGEFLAEPRENETLACFDAQEILDYVLGH